MVKRLIWLAIVPAVGLVGLACSETELQRGDAIVADVNQIGQAVRQVAEGPAGALIPVPIRTIMEVLGLSAAAAAVFWQKLRKDGVLAEKQTLTLTARAIVDAIDRLPPGTAGQVKEKVSAEMDRKGIQTTGRAVVTQLKSN